MPQVNGSTGAMATAIQATTKRTRGRPSASSAATPIRMTDAETGPGRQTISQRT